jgi:hypothetical protein
VGGSEDYIYDAFLSYKRSPGWSAYINRHFLPKLEFWLDNFLEQRSRIYLDTQLETGVAWPRSLEYALAHSKVIVCLWTKQYFSSDWCIKELSLMLARRRAAADGPEGPLPLILAVVLHDCEDVDPTLGDIQLFNLQKYANPWMSREGRTAERLSLEVQRFADHLAKAMAMAPQFEQNWLGLEASEFQHLYKGTPRQDRPPSIGGGMSG